jgi:hypothetical protein
MALAHHQHNTVGTLAHLASLHLVTIPFYLYLNLIWYEIRFEILQIYMQYIIFNLVYLKC